ncbi:MAG: hypothetical protein A2Y12_13960 [Planctomycetes bacterium GWF2_42_9]|nr:MAG: hypothetical protein A2Y12_13960 [Planctomycetes bacterium GWF2_42_9]
MKNTNQFRKITVGLFIFLASTYVFASKSVDPNSIPTPPEKTNACFLNNSFIPFDQTPSKEISIELLVHITDVQHYSVITEGQWEKHWYLIKCEIIESKENWEDKELKFICFDKWPTADSGIKIKKGLFPYLEGRYFRFYLEDKQTLPIIIGQQQTSPVASYENINRFVPDLKDPNQKEIYNKITQAASKINQGNIFLIHESNNYYVVEHVSWENNVGSVLYTIVEKCTYEAIPLTEIEAIKKIAAKRLNTDSNKLDFEFWGHLTNCIAT